MAARRRTWLAGLFLLVFGAGCSDQDADRLARVARTAVGKVEGLTVGAHGRVATGWQAIQADLHETALDARIAARLHWDKALSDARIEVHTTAGRAELRGTVQTAEQRRRALALAESTAGADQVVDRLEVLGGD